MYMLTYRIQTFVLHGNMKNIKDLEKHPDTTKFYLNPHFNNKLKPSKSIFHY